MVRALASHQCGPGSNPGVGAILVWVEFVVGSLLCCKRFSFGYSGLPLASKSNISKFQFDQESGRRRTTLWMCYLQFIIIIIIIYYYYLPEGMSTEQTGTLTSFKVDNASPNGGRAFPLKLKPKIASTTNLYCSLIWLDDGNSGMNGMSIFSHCVTRFLKSCFSDFLG